MKDPAHMTLGLKPGRNGRVLSIELLEARRRYSNARRRARYWSGIPTFRPWGRSNETRTSKLWEKYELAMCDCNAWESRIEELTGKRPEHYDPKSAFAVRFTQLMGKASNNTRRKPSA